MIDDHPFTGNEARALLLLSASMLLDRRASRLQRFFTRALRRSIDTEFRGLQPALETASQEQISSSSVLGPEPGEKVAQIGIKRRNGATYRVTRDGDVAEQQSERDQIIVRAAVTREAGWLYYLDDDGDVSRRTIAAANEWLRQTSPDLLAHSSLRRVLSVPRGIRVLVDPRCKVAAAIYEPQNNLTDEEEMAMSLSLEKHGATWIDVRDLHPAYDSVTMILPKNLEEQRQIFWTLGIEVERDAQLWALALHCRKSR